MTHVLAGPFASYQLAVLGADVIKIENPSDPDQTRITGLDSTASDSRMGTSYLTQSSNKRSLTTDLKTSEGQEILRRLVKTADVLLQNYRPGSLEALGLGPDEMMKINPRLIYCSLSAYGQQGPKRDRTAYDSVIQASSGIMAMNGTPEVEPMMIKGSLIDYATGTTGAFAIASALFQREKTGRGQKIDLAMEDVGFILMSNHLVGYLYNGTETTPHSKSVRVGTGGYFETADGLLMLAASNWRQHRRFWTLMGRPEFGQRRCDSEHMKLLVDILKQKTAQEWEDYLQANHIPAGRVRTMAEAVLDKQFEHRRVTHKHPKVENVDGPVTVPVAAFMFEHGGPSIETPPPPLGADTQRVLEEIGYSAADIDALRQSKVV